MVFKFLQIGLRVICSFRLLTVIRALSFYVVVTHLSKMFFFWFRPGLTQFRYNLV